MWSGFIWLATVSRPVSSVKVMVTVWQQSHYQLHKKESTLQNYTILFVIDNPYTGCLLHVPHCCQSLSWKILLTYLITLWNDKERQTMLKRDRPWWLHEKWKLPWPTSYHPIKKAWCGPECSRKFSPPHFHDIRHMKMVRLSASRTGRLYPRKCS